MVTILRPLSTSELLDRTFHLYRNHFLVFVGITAIPQLFILPLTLGGAAMMARHRASTSVAMLLSGYMLFYLAWFISQAPTIAAVSDLQMDKPISIGSAYSSSKRSLLRVIWIVFLLFLILGGSVTVGMIAIGAVVGALAASASAPWVIAVVASSMLYFLLRWMLSWSLAIPATVLEGGWFLASVRRSRVLSKGSRWRIFWVYFLLGVFAAVVSFTIQFLLMLSIGFFPTRDPIAIQAAIQAVQAVGVFLSTSVVGAVATIAISLIYYDQRVRKEGLDLQMMMSRLEPVAQTAAANVNP